MAVYIVTYDLIAPGRNYDALLAAVRRYPNAQALFSAFFVETTATSTFVRDDLTRYIDSNDKLYVMQITRDWASNNRGLATEWLLNPLRNF